MDTLRVCAYRERRNGSLSDGQRCRAEIEIDSTPFSSIRGLHRCRQSIFERLREIRSRTNRCCSVFLDQWILVLRATGRRMKAMSTINGESMRSTSRRPNDSDAVNYSSRDREKSQGERRSIPLTFRRSIDSGIANDWPMDKRSVKYQW